MKFGYIEYNKAYLIKQYFTYRAVCRSLSSDPHLQITHFTPSIFQICLFPTMHTPTYIYSLCGGHSHLVPGNNILWRVPLLPPNITRPHLSFIAMNSRLYIYISQFNILQIKKYQIRRIRTIPLSTLPLPALTMGKYFKSIMITLRL